MLRFLARAALLLLSCAAITSVAAADSVPIGLFSLDATGASSGEFDVTNLTGTSSLPPDFPVTTALSISITSVVITFESGPSLTLDASHFASDGFGGWLGNDSFNLLSSPILSATITGTLSPLSGISGLPTGDSILPGFSATLTDVTGGPLELGDTVVLDATTGTSTGGGGTPTPEPGTMLLIGSGAFAMSFFRRKRSARQAQTQAAL